MKRKDFYKSGAKEEGETCGTGERERVAAFGAGPRQRSGGIGQALAAVAAKRKYCEWPPNFILKSVVISILFEVCDPIFRFEWDGE